MIIKTFNSLDIFKKRREKLNSLAGPDCVFILFSGEEGHLAPFRTQSSFVYLTGFEEPEACAIIKTGKKPEFFLFVRDRDPALELWDGERFGPLGAKKDFGADQAFSLKELHNELPQLLRGQSSIFYSMGEYLENDKIVFSARKQAVALDRRSGKSLSSLCDPNQIISQMRVIKDSHEKAWMKDCCELSAKAHTYAMKSIQPGMTEKQIQGILIFSFMQQNATTEGYTSIVASGANATTLHYRANNRKTQKNELILIDAGAEKNYYKADITRTYPVDGKFTSFQHEFYQAVLEVQKDLIHKVIVGFSLPELQEEAIRQLTQVMIDLKLLKGKLKDLIKNKSYQKYYPHGVGHYLGLDVHDVGFSKKDDQPVPFQAGMVITVEPGIYVPLGDQEAPKEFRGLGVRIEDDIYITKTRPEILTALAPKEIKALEAVVGSEPLRLPS